jgi:hypothetical protein
LRDDDIQDKAAQLAVLWRAALAKLIAGSTSQRESVSVAVVREPIDDEPESALFWREGEA